MTLYYNVSDAGFKPQCDIRLNEVDGKIIWRWAIPSKTEKKRDFGIQYTVKSPKNQRMIVE